MQRINNSLPCILGVLIAMVVIVSPFAMMFFTGADQTSAGSVVPMNSGDIILRTIAWSLFVGLISTTKKVVIYIV